MKSNEPTPRNLGYISLHETQGASDGAIILTPLGRIATEVTSTPAASTWRSFMHLYRCPLDAGHVAITGTALRCERCGTGYPIDMGFPDFRGGGSTRLAQDLWAETQDAFEQAESWVDARMQKRNDDATVGIYANMPPLSGLVLDVGGSYGLIRRFAPTDCELLVIDPWLGVLAQAARLANDPAYIQAHPFIGTPFAFACGYAEALPLADAEFDIVHMRSMLDHVSGPLLALTEAYRVLKPRNAGWNWL